MTTVGFIGSGRIGTVLAKLSVAAGYEVLLSNSRGPETLKDLAAEVGAHAVTPAEAAQADLVVVSIPVKAYPSVPAIDGKVVKVFNNIYFKHLEHLARPGASKGDSAEDRSYLPIAGDDQAAKAAVTAYLDTIGYGAVDTGSLADGRRQQPGTPVYGAPYGAFDDERGRRASAGVIRAALDAA
jgi:8-hydroxy-5-deazaflavin:NADPH oxidoreductase